MKNIKNNFALYALVIGLLLTFSHTAQAQDVPDGFDPNANSLVRSIAVQTDGKILIGGDFTTLNGGTVTRNHIARLGFAPSAASVSIGGRVTTATGRGISRAMVSATDGNGNVLTTTTNSFGYYSFAELPAGDTYIFSVRAKHYQFAQPSQVLFINEEQNEVNFTAFLESKFR